MTVHSKVRKHQRNLCYPMNVCLLKSLQKAQFNPMGSGYCALCHTYKFNSVIKNGRKFFITDMCGLLICLHSTSYM